jgi:exosortase
MDEKPVDGVLEEFRVEFLAAWERLPNKGFFLALLAAWLALFQFLGNSTLGYVRSPSIFAWMLNAIHPTGDYMASDEGHAVLMPFVVLGLFWWKRKQLLELRLDTWAPGLLIVLFSLFLHLVGFLAQQPRLSVIAMFVGIYGLMGLTWGPQWLRASFFPFFLLAFCLPLGNLLQPITFALRMLVVHLVEFVANTVLALGIIREGAALIDPNHQYQYEVAAACSGLRSQISTAVLAIVYAFVSFDSWWKRAVLIAAAVPLAVLGNLARMLTIIFAAEMGGQSWGDYVHDGGPGGFFSLLPYIPAFIGLILIGGWLRGPEPQDPKPKPELAAAAADVKCV